jgi:hypothetical protein
MTNITINDKKFEGNLVEVANGETKIDGKKVGANATDNLEITMNSNGETQTANVNVGNGNITIQQNSKKGDNIMKISF